MDKLAYEVDGISPTRKALDQAIIRAIEVSLRFLGTRWLALVNLVNFGFFGGALLTPVITSLGLTWVARPLFSSYSLVCHQLPFRSDFIFGYQVAMCQRNMAIYGSMFLAGVGFAFVRTRLKPLPWRWYLVLIAPMSIDGFTQLFGFRESNWTLRVITGTLFGVATVWLAYPYLQLSMSRLLAPTAIPGKEDEGDR
ncbi:MAG: DUF2085 domain-containing protein [Chloroflexi bacterium]|nr:DUF2085 domain-containing protein [Chloroflexota bacterium]